MDDRLKQSISALMDDEADELELQRILSHSDQDAVNTTWHAYHGIRDVLKSETNDSFHIDISAAVAREIHADDQVDENQSASVIDSPARLAINEHSLEQVKGKGAGASWYARLGGGFAVAASIAFAFFFVLQSGVDSDIVQERSITYTEMSDDKAAAGLDNNVNSLLTVASSGSGTDSNAAGSSLSQPKVSVDLTEEQVRHFNQYLLRHAEHAVQGARSGFMPLARVASVNSVGI